MNKKIQSFFNNELQLKTPVNPKICLYHSTHTHNLPLILTKGLDPTSVPRCEEIVREVAAEDGITDEDEISDMLVECGNPAIMARWELDNMLSRNEGVYFVKNENNILGSTSIDTTVEVPAELIPCKCIEVNYDIENELYDMLYGLYSDYGGSGESQEEIWAKEDEVRATIRPLDTKNNPYTTEVICPCHIPASIIKPYKNNKIGSCKIEK